MEVSLPPETDTRRMHLPEVGTEPDQNPAHVSMIFREGPYSNQKHVSTIDSDITLTNKGNGTKA